MHLREAFLLNVFKIEIPLYKILINYTNYHRIIFPWAKEILSFSTIWKEVRLRRWTTLLSFVGKYKKQYIRSKFWSCISSLYPGCLNSENTIFNGKSIPPYNPFLTVISQLQCFPGFCFLQHGFIAGSSGRRWHEFTKGFNYNIANWSWFCVWDIYI